MAHQNESPSTVPVPTAAPKVVGVYVSICIVPGIFFFLYATEANIAPADSSQLKSVSWLLGFANQLSILIRLSSLPRKPSRVAALKRPFWSNISLLVSLGAGHKSCRYCTWIPKGLPILHVRYEYVITLFCRQEQTVTDTRSPMQSPELRRITTLQQQHHNIIYTAVAYWHIIQNNAVARRNVTAACIYT